MPAKIEGCYTLPYFISPLCAFVTVVLFSIAFFCPNAPTVHDLSQITISPSTEWRPPNQAPAPQPDGPTVWFGIFGSCARKNRDADITCTSMSFYPTYDFSVLPRNAPTYVLKGLPLVFKLTGFISFCLWPPLFLWITWLSYHHTFGGQHPWLEKMLFRSPSFPLLGLFSSLLGGMNFWILGLYLDRVCQHFNDFVGRQGANGPKLIASRGNGLLLGCIGLLLFAFPWLVLLKDTFDIEDSEPASVTKQDSDSIKSTLKTVKPKVVSGFGADWGWRSSKSNPTGTPALSEIYFTSPNHSLPGDRTVSTNPPLPASTPHMTPNSSGSAFNSTLSLPVPSTPSIPNVLGSPGSYHSGHTSPERNASVQNDSQRTPGSSSIRDGSPPSPVMFSREEKGKGRALKVL